MSSIVSFNTCTQFPRTKCLITKLVHSNTEPFFDIGFCTFVIKEFSLRLADVIQLPWLVLNLQKSQNDGIPDMVYLNSCP